jgi:hypothetical protein
MSYKSTQSIGSTTSHVSRTTYHVKRTTYHVPRITYHIVFLFLSFQLQAQDYLPLNREFLLSYDREMAKKKNGFHTGVKPYNSNELDSIIQTDSLYDFKPYSISRKYWLSRIADNLLNRHFINIDTAGLVLRVDPLLNMDFGKESVSGKKLFTNSRGVQAYGSVGKKVSFYTSFYENQATFSPYIDSFITEYRVVPGQGESKPFKPGTINKAYDYNMAYGWVTYSPDRYFNFQFGQGKNFVGDGYRSLLLSDNSFAYPFLKVTTSVWKIKYMNLFTQFQDIRGGQSAVNGKGTGYPKKYGTFHYLSVLIGKSLQVGLFESIIWPGGDSTQKRGYDAAYLNPIIFYRSVEFANGSSDNALMGLNLKYKVNSKWYVYGQFVLDDFKLKEFKEKNERYQQKYGYQIGTRVFDPLEIKNLTLQAEYNSIMPYTYSHRAIEQNYSHYNQALAHPLGANFKEVVALADYRFRRWFVALKYVYAKYGVSEGNIHYGKNIFIPDYGGMYNGVDYKFPYAKHAAQGPVNTLQFLEMKAGYLVNPNINMRLFASYTIRKLDGYAAENKMTRFYAVGISTNLQNMYFDF